MERLTLIGLYNYDDSLFDDITLPSDIDSDLTVDAILHRGGQFEVIYPEYDFLKSSITSWFKRHYRTFDKWITALNIEYDPLNNYDRYEESTDNRAYSDNEAGSHSQENSHNEAGSTQGSENTSSTQKANSASSTDGTTTGTQGNTVTNTVSAFDSNTFQNKDQQSTSGSDSSSTSGNTVTNNLTDESGERSSQTNDTRKSKDSSNINNSINKNGIDKNQHSAHLYGNIGVTTSQQMLQSELDIARFNIYNEIAELFIDDFCILVY